MMQARAGGIAIAVALATTPILTVASPARAATCGTERGGWQARGQFTGGLQDGVQRFEDRVRFADLDGDGRADYLVLDDGGGVRVWYNRGGDGNGGWQYGSRIAKGAGVAPGQVEFADVDGDGRADYLVVNAGGEVDAYLNRGGDTFDNNGFHPGWEPHPQFARGDTGPGRIMFADIDGDGKADYVVADRTTGALTAWINKGGDRPGVDGWQGRGQIASGGLDNSGDNPQFTTLRLADVTCDRRADYLAVHNRSGAIKAWVNNGGDNGGGGWGYLGLIAAGAGSASVQFADIDGDGRADYLVLNRDGSVTAYINRGGDRDPSVPGG